MAKLPTGLAGAWDALMPYTDKLDRILSLAFIRQLMDPDMPTLAGFDPRTITSSPDGHPLPSWEVIVADEHNVEMLALLCARVNDLTWAASGEAHLCDAQAKLDGRRTGPFWTTHRAATARALREFSRWNCAADVHYTGGDVLGQMLELLRPGKAAHGAYYTPYGVCHMMAKINDVQPGCTTRDPTCGSGRMLLAAIHTCRENHPGEQDPHVFGVDIDPDAVKATKLNLILCGYGVAGQAAGEANLQRLPKAVVATRDSEQGQQLLLALEAQQNGQRRPRAHTNGTPAVVDDSDQLSLI